MTSSSFFLIIALATFALGVVLYLVAISSTSWQGLSDEFTISLWKECYKMHVSGEWVCESWRVIPDFVRSAQAFCIISLLCYIACSCILVASFILRCVHRSRIALIVISLLTFTSACMIAMAVFVMGLKGKDHLTELKSNPDVIYQYYLRGTVVTGNYEIGWALILAIVASLVNFSSFLFFLLEYKDITDVVPRPTKV